MKYLGLDYGGKRIGVAISDRDGRIAFPRETIKNDGETLRFLTDLIKSEHIDRVVVGDTRSDNGTENPITEAAERFMDELAREGGKPVSRAFELFSSVEVSRYAPEIKQHDDAAAAAFILQRFLDMNDTHAAP